MIRREDVEPEARPTADGLRRVERFQCVGLHLCGQARPGVLDLDPYSPDRVETLSVPWPFSVSTALSTRLVQTWCSSAAIGFDLGHVRRVVPDHGDVGRQPVREHHQRAF
jgi:hypothetical protein